VTKIFIMMRKIITLISIMLFTGMMAFPKVAPQKYFVQFTNKNGTPFTVDHPEAFLSARAIQRRMNQGIPIVDEDLPVNPTYVNTIHNMGVTVLTRCKWLNGITIYAPDSTVIPGIQALPFVAHVERCVQLPQNGEMAISKFTLEDLTKQTGDKYQVKSGNTQTSFNYGPSYTQIHMLNGDALHALGFRGQGKQIAILDAGFNHANELPVFDSLFQNHQILGTKDFVNPGNNVYNEYAHGTWVLSILGGNVPGRLIGTAPKAGYWLLRTEDAATENIIEEYNWVAGAEFADSAGADIITSSLGYFTFNDPAKNHTWADLTGNSTPVTKGANIAANKGIAVINSAGNEGQHLWRYLIFPADGVNVLAVAGVDSLRNYVPFSSVGYLKPSNYIKPNVAAMAFDTYLAREDSSFGPGIGTSFSSPLISGMVACLWQSAPAASNFRLYQVIEQSASQYAHPDSLLGYGIPDFSKAMTLLSIPEKITYPTTYYPNPFNDHFTLTYHSPFTQDVMIDIYDMIGERVYQNHSIHCWEGDNKISINGLSDIQKGCYILKFTTEISSDSHQLIKVN
jgi:serine protease AprX